MYYVSLPSLYVETERNFTHATCNTRRITDLRIRVYICKREREREKGICSILFHPHDLLLQAKQMNLRPLVSLIATRMFVQNGLWDNIALRRGNGRPTLDKCVATIGHVSQQI